LQSYGGFCAVTYLSFAPEGLKSVLLTGGLPPLGEPCTADTVYRACFKQVQQQNEKYYKRYPQDIQVVHEVVRYLSESEGGGVSHFNSQYICDVGNLFLCSTAFAGSSSIWWPVNP
jgi:hypothetical protein